MTSGDSFINSYLAWLKDKMYSTEIGQSIEITTPFLDNKNDHIQIYISNDPGGLVLSDDGVTMSELMLSGCDFSTPKRQQILTSLLNGVGVKEKDSVLYVEATEQNFPQKKHALLQAILAVNDMFMLSHSRVSSVFLEDVELFLYKNDIRYTPSVQFTGKSGFQHTFDFVIPASRIKPERLLKAINSPTKEKTESILFSWDDTKNMRRKDSSMYVFVNDEDKKIKADIYGAFKQYGITPVAWSERSDIIPELSA